VSYNYAVPFDRTFSSAPKRLTEGWNIVGITRFATGFPVAIRQSGDLSLVGSAGSTDVPNFVGPWKIQDPRLSGPPDADGNVTPNQYFSKDGFVSGPDGGFGNANRRFFHGPGFNNWDFGVHKTTKLREGMTLQFRIEFFNIFNHTNLNVPRPTFGSSFGVT
jgi:hypothetical protein